MDGTRFETDEWGVRTSRPPSGRRFEHPARPAGETSPAPPVSAEPSAHGAAPPEDTQQLEAVGRLAAGVAHDFNNLLSVILSCAEELETALTDPDQVEQAGEIRLAAQRGARLTRQLLSHSRPDPVDTEEQPIDVNLAVAETMGLLTRTLGEGITLRNEPTPGLPKVLLAPGHIGQILVNLAANSRDAMPRGGTVTIRTELISVAPGDERLGTGWYVRLSVTDSGAGMSQEVAQRALEPFFTTKQPGSGTGLGLATIAEIVRGAGGDVRISTSRGGGTSVAVDLPAVRNNGDPLALVPRSRPERERAEPRSS